MKLKECFKFMLAHGSMLVPYGRDLYLKYVGARNGISYRGVFGSFAGAKAHVDAERSSDYDQINLGKAEKITLGSEKIDSWFHDYDYPFLFWVSQLVRQENSLLELGGSLGHFYYSSQQFYNYPDHFHWQIAELPEAVELGRKLARQRNEHKLTFSDSATLQDTMPTNLFVSAGTLQYMQQNIDELVLTLPKMPEHIVLHMLPVHPTESFWTLQNLSVVELPYRIYSEYRLLKDLEGMGYTLRTRWANPRSVDIPFHREQSVREYIGLYAQRTQ